MFKRGMKGVYQHCAHNHLHRYLAEFDFRYNNRKALGQSRRFIEAAKKLGVDQSGEAFKRARDELVPKKPKGGSS